MEDSPRINKGMCNLLLLSFLSFFVVFPSYHHHELVSDTQVIDEPHECDFCKYKAVSGEVLEEAKKSSVINGQKNLSLLDAVSFTTSLFHKANLIRGPPTVLI